MTTYQVLWFFLVGLLLTVFAVLDGFDLGVGFWHIFTKGDRRRRALIRAVGPHWDGNEVWLLTGGAALFAAFPRVYATVFSGFYLAMMLLVVALMLRAVSLEFRDKGAGARWRRVWDGCFFGGSAVATLLFGVALGNILRGIPLDGAENYTGTFWDLLNPYALTIGLVGFAMIAFHGALYIALRTGGEQQALARRWARGAGLVYLALFIVSGIATIRWQDHLMTNYRAIPLLWFIPVLALAAICGALVFNVRRRPGRAFTASSLSIVGLMATAAADLFPRLVPALGRPELSLTLANASSSELTLKTMLILVIVGMPFVIGYTLWVYRAFQGRVDLDAEAGSY